MRGASSLGEAILVFANTYDLTYEDVRTCLAARVLSAHQLDPWTWVLVLDPAITSVEDAVAAARTIETLDPKLRAGGVDPSMYLGRPKT